MLLASLSAWRVTNGHSTRLIQQAGTSGTFIPHSVRNVPNVAATAALATRATQQRQATERGGSGRVSTRSAEETLATGRRCAGELNSAWSGVEPQPSAANFLASSMTSWVLPAEIALVGVQFITIGTMPCSSTAYAESGSGTGCDLLGMAEPDVHLVRCQPGA